MSWLLVVVNLSVQAKLWQVLSYIIYSICFCNSVTVTVTHTVVCGILNTSN